MIQNLITWQYDRDSYDSPGWFPLISSISPPPCQAAYPGGRCASVEWPWWRRVSSHPEEDNPGLCQVHFIFGLSFVCVCVCDTSIPVQYQTCSLSLRNIFFVLFLSSFFTNVKCSLTCFWRPLKTTANAPWPIKSFFEYSYFSATCSTVIRFGRRPDLNESNQHNRVSLC